MTSSGKDAIEEVRALLEEYEQFLSGKAEGTTDAYLRTVRHLIGWVAQRPGNEGQFQPSQLTQTAVELYLAHLEQEGLSLNHRARVKSTISNFANFLIEEKEVLQRNPTRGIELPPSPLLWRERCSGESDRSRQSSALARAALSPALVGRASGRSTWSRPLRSGLLGRMPGERGLLAADGTYSCGSRGGMAPCWL